MTEKTGGSRVAFAPPASPLTTEATCSIGLDLPDGTDLTNPSLTRVTCALLTEPVVTATEFPNPEAAGRRREVAHAMLAARRVGTILRRSRRRM
jgi:hypothetical protein